jgi:ABC-type Fe3+ transport system substrate-binding protein
LKQVRALPRKTVEGTMAETNPPSTQREVSMASFARRAAPRIGALTACAVAGAALIAVAPNAAAAIEMTPELQKIVDGAKQEGRLEVMMADSPFGGSRAVPVVQAGINKMFGTNVTVRWTPGPPYAAMGAKVLTEHQAKQPASTDAYLATAVQFAPLIKAGLFREVDWAKLYPERIKPSMVEGNKTMLRIYTSLPGVVYNKSVEAAVLKTQSLDDFLKPEWKGKFATTPYLAGFDVLIADNHWGAGRTEAYVKKLAQQVGWLHGCGGPDRIASGEIPVLVFDCSGADVNEPKFKNVLGLHVMKDTAQRRYGYYGIPKNSAHPNTAILYTLWYSSPEGQAKMFELVGYDMSDHPGSVRGREIAALEAKGFKFQDVTLDWWNSQPKITPTHVKLIRLLQAESKK